MNAKLTDDVRRALGELPTAYIGDGMSRLGLKGWLPGLASRGATKSTGCFVGQANTVQWAPKQGRGGGMSNLYKIIRKREDEQILIVAGGKPDCYLLGDNTISAAKLSGFEAILVDGSIRDSVEIAGADVGVFSAGVDGAHPDWLEIVADGIPVMFRGQWVEPGDVVAADSDGALVFQASRASEVLEEAQAIQSLEQEQGELISREGPLEELLHILERKERAGAR